MLTLISIEVQVILYTHLGSSGPTVLYRTSGVDGRTAQRQGRDHKLKGKSYTLFPIPLRRYPTEEDINNNIL